jgi:hypothetical protein
MATLFAVYTAKLKVGMLMIGPGPPGVVAAAVWALTYGLEVVSKSGSRKFAPVDDWGVGPLASYVKVPGSTLDGTMKLCTR